MLSQTPPCIIETRKRFADDFNLPIHLFHDPYWDYLVALYDPMFGVSDKLRMWNEVSDLFKESHDFKQAMVQAYIQHTRYLEYCTMPTVAIGCTAAIQNIYQQQHDGRWFISIDMRNANFAALQDYGFFPDISYAKLAGLHSPHRYFAESKKIRQVIFGNEKLYPVKQRRIQFQWMTDYVWNALPQFTEKCFISPDEIIVDTTTINRPYKDILEDIYRAIGQHITGIKVISFRLKVVDKFFVKEYIDGTFEFKYVPSYLFPQVLKHYMGRQVNEMDTTFYHEGRLARFIEPYFTEV